LKNRTAERLRLADLTLDDPDSAPLVDASRSGLRFFTNRLYWVGADVAVAFPSLDSSPLQQDGRVVRLEELPTGGRRVSVVLQREAKATRLGSVEGAGRELRTRQRSPNDQRITKHLRVWVRGWDRNGNPFLQSADSINISRGGARLDGGISFLTRKGQTIEVQYRQRSARYAVVWTGPIHKPQIGICCLDDPSNNIFGLTQ
jgi:hypothetical protein